MKPDTLLDAIGMINDEYVQDAKSVRVVKRSHPWLKWSAMAAGVCVLVYLGLQSGFAGGFSEDCATNDAACNTNGGSGNTNNTAIQESILNTDGFTNDAPQMDESDSSGIASGDGNGNTGEGWQESNEHKENIGTYPYNDKLVLDYVGMELGGMDTLGGTIVFHEIADMEMYRELNNLSTEEGEVYFDTRNSLYQCLETQADTKYFINTREAGLVPGKTGNVAYEEACISSDKFAGWVAITDYLLSDMCLEDSVEGAICDRLETVALGTNVANSPNGQVTMLVSKNLNALGSGVQVFVDSMRENLGTEHSCKLYGQEIVVQYFYQQRMLREEVLEECYQYYAYFEVEGVEYLCQYSSNWTLPGEAVTALHNPPHTISQALSQEESREQFVGMLTTMVQVVLTKPE